MKIELSNRSLGALNFGLTTRARWTKFAIFRRNLAFALRDSGHNASGEKKLKLYEAFAYSMPSASALLGPFALLPSLPRQRRSQKDSGRGLSLEIS